MHASRMQCTCDAAPKPQPCRPTPPRPPAGRATWRPAPPGWHACSGQSPPGTPPPRVLRRPPTAGTPRHALGRAPAGKATRRSRHRGWTCCGQRAGKPSGHAVHALRAAAPTMHTHSRRPQAHPHAGPAPRLACSRRSLNISSCRPSSSTQGACPVGGSLSTQSVVPSRSGTQHSGSSRRTPAGGQEGGGGGWGEGYCRARLATTRSGSSGCHPC